MAAERAEGTSSRGAGGPTLIVGGGFLGGWVATTMAEAGRRVRVLSRASRGWGRLADATPGLEKIEGDVADPSVVRQALEGVTSVFYAVGAGAPGTSQREPATDLDTYLVPFVRFLDLAADAGVRRIVLASSGGTVYGPVATLPVSEDHPTNPVSGYGVLKLACEKYLALAARRMGLTTVALRLSNLYGEGQDARSGFGVIRAFVERVRAGQAIEIFGAGDVIRDFLFVEDAARAAALALDLALAEGTGVTFNVGAGRGTSITELVAIIEELGGRTVPVQRRGPRAFDVPASVLDIRRFTAATGWQPQVDLRTGLVRLLAAQDGDATGTAGSDRGAPGPATGGPPLRGPVKAP